MFNMLMLFAEPNNSWIMLVVLGVLIVALLVGSYVMQKRNKKKVEEVRSKLSIGDVIITMGGIKGTVTSINDAEETLNIKTGEDSIITIFKAAIQHINPQLTQAAKAAESVSKEEAAVEEVVTEVEKIAEVEAVAEVKNEEVAKKEDESSVATVEVVEADNSKAQEKVVAAKPKTTKSTSATKSTSTTKKSK